MIGSEPPYAGARALGSELDGRKEAGKRQGTLALYCAGGEKRLVKLQADEMLVPSEIMMVGRLMARWRLQLTVSCTVQIRTRARTKPRTGH